MDWERLAEALAESVTPPASRWRHAIAITPRHEFVPRWWDTTYGGWVARVGAEDEEAWARTAYSDRSIVTEVAGLHADHADAGTGGRGRPTSSSTLPSLVARMYDYAQVLPGVDVLDVGTGSGYGAALLATRLGDEQVTTIDVDPYVTKVAGERMAALGLHPAVLTADTAEELPGTYDRIVAMVSVRPVPAAWMRALRPGGRLVTVIAGTSLILTATKAPDDDPEWPGWAIGRIEWERAGFMHARPAPGDYPAERAVLFANVRDARGEDTSVGRYPVIDVEEAWDISSMLELAAPNIEHHHQRGADGSQTAWMIHPDGSWARATGDGDEPPIVHQAGPRRLWDLLDQIRHRWVTHGELPVRGAHAYVTPDGVIHLARGDWHANIAGPGDEPEVDRSA